MRFCRTFAVIAVVMTLFSVFSMTAFAANYDDEPIFDGAGLFSESELEEIQKAIDSISDTVGADTRVITVLDIGDYANMDAFLYDIEKSTDSWRTPGGGRKTNLIVFAMSLNDRWACIYAGGSWDKALDNGTNDRIRTDFMNPEFKDGAYANGFIRAIGETERVIDLHLHPAVQPPVVVNVEPAAPKEPMNPALKTFLILFIPVTFLLVLLIWALRKLFLWRKEVNTRRRMLEAERVAMRESALARRDATTQVTNELDDPMFLPALKAKINKYLAIDPTKKDFFAEQLSEFEQRRRNSAVAMQSASSAAVDASDNDLSIEIYRNMTTAYTVALAHANAAKEVCAHLEGEFVRIDQKLASFDAVMAKRTQAYTDVQEQLKALRLQEIKIPAEEVAEFEKMVSDLETEVPEPTVAYIDAVVSMTKQAENISMVLGELARIAIKLASSLPALAAVVSATDERLDEVKAVCDELTQNYAPENWSDVEPNVSEAERVIIEAKTCLEEAERLYSEKSYYESKHELGIAVTDFNTARALLDEIPARKTLLEERRERLPNELREIEATLETARDYQSMNRDDLTDSGVPYVMQDIERELEFARESYDKVKPNYIELTKMTQNIKRKADSALQSLKNEVAEAEKARRKAAEQLERAKKELEEAKRYARNNSGDISHAAMSDLRAAENELSRVGGLNMRDVAMVLMVAQSLNNHSSRAMSNARRDVQAAEAARAAERRRREEERRRQEARRRQEEDERRRRNSSSSFSSGSSSSGHFGSGKGGSSSSGRW